MLSRFDYSPKGTLLGFATDAASRPISEVHDFLTGKLKFLLVYKSIQYC